MCIKIWEIKQIKIQYTQKISNIIFFHIFPSWIAKLVLCKYANLKESFMRMYLTNYTLNYLQYDILAAVLIYFL